MNFSQRDSSVLYLVPPTLNTNGVTARDVSIDPIPGVPSDNVQDALEVVAARPSYAQWLPTVLGVAYGFVSRGANALVGLGFNVASFNQRAINIYNNINDTLHVFNGGDNAINIHNVSQTNGTGFNGTVSILNATDMNSATATASVIISRAGRIGDSNINMTESIFMGTMGGVRSSSLEMRESMVLKPYQRLGDTRNISLGSTLIGGGGNPLTKPLTDRTLDPYELLLDGYDKVSIDSPRDMTLDEYDSIIANELRFNPVTKELVVMPISKFMFTTEIETDATGEFKLQFRPPAVPYNKIPSIFAQIVRGASSPGFPYIVEVFQVNEDYCRIKTWRVVFGGNPSWIPQANAKVSVMICL